MCCDPSQIDRHGLRGKSNVLPMLLGREPASFEEAAAAFAVEGALFPVRGLSMPARPEKVYFTGSIALDTVEEVFREVGTTCGRRLRRVPDGEPGGRRLWISWQWPLLRANAYLREAERQPAGYVGPPVMELRPGVDPGDVGFGELGYAREARTAYHDFCSARDRGEPPGDVKFQVSLPTPFAVLQAFIVPESRQAVLPGLRTSDVQRSPAHHQRDPARRPRDPVGRLRRDGHLGWAAIAVPPGPGPA
jgi:hypothetical protein